MENIKLFAYHPDGNSYGEYESIYYLGLSLAREIGRKNDEYLSNYLGLNFNIIRKNDNKSRYGRLSFLNTKDIECIVFDAPVKAWVVKKFLKCLLSPYSGFRLLKEDKNLIKKKLVIVSRDMTKIATVYNIPMACKILNWSSSPSAINVINFWDEKIKSKSKGVFTLRGKEGLTVMSIEAYKHIKNNYSVLY